MVEPSERLLCDPDDPQAMARTTFWASQPIAIQAHRSAPGELAPNGPLQTHGSEQRWTSIEHDAMLNARLHACIVELMAGVHD